MACPRLTPLTLFTGLLVRFVRIGAVYLYNTPYGWKLLLFITMSLLPVTNIGSWRKTRTCLQPQGALNALTLCCQEAVRIMPVWFSMLDETGFYAPSMAHNTLPCRPWQDISGFHVHNSTDSKQLR